MSKISYANHHHPYNEFGKHWHTGFEDGLHQSLTGAWRSHPSCVDVCGGGGRKQVQAAASLTQSSPYRT
jgi:hypothetical protein